MKKLLGCFLCVMLLFCLTTPVGADTLVMDIDDLITPSNDVSYLWYNENDTNGDILKNSGDATEEKWLNALLGNYVSSSPGWVDLNSDKSVLPGDGDYIAGYEGSYAVLKYGKGTGGAYDLYGFEHVAIMDDGDGILELYGVGNPYIGDSNHPWSQLGATVDLGEKALSHVYAAVPEPTTMLLLGAGLVGLAGFGRKRFKK